MEEGQTSRIASSDGKGVTFEEEVKVSSVQLSLIVCVHYGTDHRDL